MDHEYMNMDDGQSAQKPLLEDKQSFKKKDVERGVRSAGQGIPADHVHNRNGGGTGRPTNFNGAEISRATRVLVLPDDDDDDSDSDLDDSESGFQGESFWCSLCDDGGDLLFCDGPCLRSFHACPSDREMHACSTLGFTREQYKVILSEPAWLCPNCKAKQQLCFVCHKVGKSSGEDQEVFNCHAAHCGQFYHPMCIARRLTSDTDRQKAYADSIRRNEETFLCPSHKCRTCKELEDATDTQKPFAKCRRCPTVWHVQCLPEDVPFEEQATFHGLPQRAWKVELGDEGRQFKVGIYCPRHALPLQPHDMVKFPYRPTSRFKRPEHTSTPHEVTFTDHKEQKTGVSTSFETQSERPTTQKYRPKAAIPKVPILDSKRESLGGTTIRRIPGVLKSSGHSQSVKTELRPIISLGAAGDIKHDSIEPPLASFSHIQKSIEEIIAKSKVTKAPEEVSKGLRTPSYYITKNSEKEVKFIHEGELYSILNSIPKALSWIRDGKNMGKVKTLCPERYLKQLERVERSLETFLNPCLYGQRYTSFGRHFTKKNVLIEIVDRLQWYINEKDMIVDFCCGANDFSVEVHHKLLKSGKNCEFKNFDILAPKDDFCFEQRDWFTVQPDELPLGEKLIMGLNPPFGQRSALANAFIAHAVKFRPKLIILIVPPSTKRLEEYGYELVWEDAKLLQGQAFYLAGSISKDTKETTGFTAGEDWNHRAPPLYLWSREDWSNTHRQIAVQCGHARIVDTPLNLEEHQGSLSCHSQQVHFFCNPGTVLVGPPLYSEPNYPLAPQGLTPNFVPPAFTDPLFRGPFSEDLSRDQPDPIFQEAFPLRGRPCWPKL